MKKVAGYGRVSTVRQFKEGTSAEDQEERINNDCEKKGESLYKFYSDYGISGKKMENRPDINDLINDAKAGKFEIVKFTKLDRLGRNQRELHNFWHLIQEELNLELICIDDPSINSKGKMGKIMLGVLAMFAEFERELIRERMGAGRKIKWINGETFVGTPPYGYLWNKELKRIEIIPDQKNVYDKIVSMYIDENFSTADIVMKLNRLRIPPPSVSAKKWKTGKAKKWNKNTVCKILFSCAYLGENIYNKNVHKESKGSKYYMYASKEEKHPDEWITVKFPPMISEERWNMIQARRQYQKKKTKRKHKGYENHFMAENVLFCGECGGKMRKRLKNDTNKKNGKVRFYYVCYWKGCSAKELKIKGRDRCTLKSVDANQIDNTIFNDIVHVLSSPREFAEDWLKDVNFEEIEAKIKKFQCLVKDKERKLELAYDLITGTSDPKTIEKYKEKKKIDELELSSIRTDLKRVENERKLIHNKVNTLNEFNKALQNTNYWNSSDVLTPAKNKFIKFINNLPFKEKKRILEAVIAPENRGRCIIRYERPADLIDESEFNNYSEEELTQPLVNRKPFIYEDFDIDLNRIKKIISGLDRDELFSKFGPYGTAGRIQHSHRWRGVFR
jgi:site-specific DNA recombinase